MSTTSEFVVAVEDFQREVLDRSAQVPVLVDFWAAWCAPCRMLGPILEKLAVEYGGAFILAKVDTDVHQAAAARFGVRGIPDVRLFRDGAVAAKFVGALPEAQVRAFLREHCPSEAQLLAQTGISLLEQGDTAGAKEALERAVSQDGSLDAAHLGLAQVALAHGDLDAVAEHVKRIRPTADERRRATFLGQAADLMREAAVAGPPEALRARLEADPDDHDARFALGSYELAASRYRSALEHYLGVAERQRKWRDEAPRKAMLVVFGLIGARHPMSDEFRKKLMFIY